MLEHAHHRGGVIGRPSHLEWRRIWSPAVVLSAVVLMTCATAPAFADNVSPASPVGPSGDPSPSQSLTGDPGAGVEPTPTQTPSDSPSPTATSTPTPTPTPTENPLIVLNTNTGAGGKRLVTADASAKVDTTPAARRGAAFALRLSCGDYEMGAIQNAPRGTTLALTPRLLIDNAPQCTLYGRGAMPALQTGSIRSSGPVDGATAYTPTVPPNRIVAGQSYDYLPAEWTVPARVKTITVTGDQKVTACTSVGGSRDNGSPYLCEGHVNPVGSTVRLQVWVQQRSTKPGAFCLSKIVRSVDVKIIPQIHHYMSYKYAPYTLSTSRGCSRTVRVKVRATVLSGSDLVLHRPGSATTAFAPIG